MRCLNGNRLVVFALAAGMSAAAEAQHWEPLQSGVSGSAGAWGGRGGVRALGFMPDGPFGPLALVGGAFTSPGYAFAAWDGARWLRFGDVPLPYCFDCEHWLASISVFDDGAGPQTYIFGDFAIWPEHHGVLRSAYGPWQPLPAPLPMGGLWSRIDSMVYDDGSGPALLVAGPINGGSLRGVARWDGVAWQPLGEGLHRGGGAGVGSALGVFDESLYVGGFFVRAGEVDAANIARWDGETWSALGAGVNGVVRAIASWDDGSGEALYAAGDFSEAGGQPASNIARWDGQQWSPLEGGLDGPAYALAVFDDGRGEALFVAGSFDQADQTPARGVARWDGQQWEDLDGSLAGEGEALLAIERPPLGPALYVGGVFSSAGPVVTGSIARWVADRCRVDLNGDGVLDFFDFLEFQALFAAGDPRADFTGDGVLDFFDFLAFQSEFAAGCP